MCRVGLLTSLGVTLDAFFVEIVNHWKRAGFSVSTAAGTASKHFPDQVIIDGLTQQPRLTNARSLRDLDRWSAANSLDVIITNTATASTLSRIAKPTKLVYFCHGLHWDKATMRNIPIRAIERALLYRTDGVITLNEDDRRWFRARTHHPLLHLKHGVGLDIKKYPRVPRPMNKTLLWVGAFDKRKDPLTAVETLASLRLATKEEYTLVMAGDGPLRARTRDYAKSLNLDDAVSFPGHVDITRYMARATASLHTAHWEGLPRVLLEGLATGRPAFGFDAKGVRDIPLIHLARDRNPESLSGLIAEQVDKFDPAEDYPSHLLDNRHAADEIASLIQQVARQR